MLKTHLSLDVSCSGNPNVLRLFDTSHYCQDEDIDNLLLEVLPVNGTRWITFPVAKRFSLALNSSNLRYSVVSDTDDLAGLLDGVYEFKLSYTPNSLTVKQFYHFRVVALQTRLREQRAKLFQKECKLSREEFYQNVHRLRDIEDYLDAARYTVEEESDKAKGIELYQWADTLLKDYSHECQC